MGIGFGTPRAILALASFVLFALSPRVEAIPILSAGSATVTVGDKFTIPVAITNAVDLTSFQFDLSFASSILKASVAGATAGAFLPGDWLLTSPGTVDNTLGAILGVSAFGSAVSGSGVLATIEFEAIAAGTSPLTLLNVAVNLFEPFTLANGKVCVNPAGATCADDAGQAPAPGTLALLAMGLAVLIGRRRLTNTG